MTSSLSHDGARCHTSDELRACIRAHLRRVAPADEIDFIPFGAEIGPWSAQSTYASRLLDAYPTLPESEFAPGVRAARAQGGVFSDCAVYDARARRELALFREVGAPLGVRSQLVGLGSFRGQRSFTLFATRYGGVTRPFREREVDAVRALVPEIAVLEAAFRHTATALPTNALTRRECEVAELIALGLANADVAEQLGTSINTVRKQALAVFDKLGVANRTQLAALFHGGHRGPSSEALEHVLARCRARRVSR